MCSPQVRIGRTLELLLGGETFPPENIDLDFIYGLACTACVLLRTQPMVFSVSCVLIWNRADYCHAFIFSIFPLILFLFPQILKLYHWLKIFLFHINSQLKMVLFFLWNSLSVHQWLAWNSILTRAGQTCDTCYHYGKLNFCLFSALTTSHNVWNILFNFSQGKTKFPLLFLN